jgi:hypothetical protein
VPYNRLIEFAWGDPSDSLSSLKSRVRNIRTKLGLPRDGEPGIRAVAGVGYALHGF